MTSEQSLQLEASEAMVALAELHSSNEMIMRSSVPSKIDLAILNANCIIICKLAGIIGTWAIMEYRKPKEKGV